mmetsp:Transcript_88731/g.211862  ORF Transcript_88731/g.211862 Transcript_88731/m.211862 type:complete len:343 (-) Transcript_88731:393-1421(-)
MNDLAGRRSTEAIQVQLPHTLLTLSGCLREDVTSHGESSEGALAVRRTPELLHLVKIVLTMLFGTTDLHASSTKEKCPLDRIHAAESVMNRVHSRLLSVRTNLFSEIFFFIFVQITELTTKSIGRAGRQPTNFLVQPSLPPEEFLRLFNFLLLLLDVLFLPRNARFFAACSLHARGSLHDVRYRCDCPRNVRGAVAVEPKHFATLCCHGSKVASHPGPSTNRSSNLGGTHQLLHLRKVLDVKHLLKHRRLLRKAPGGQLGEAAVTPEVGSPGMQGIQGCLCLCTGCSHLHAGILHRRWTVSKGHVTWRKAARRAGVVRMLAELPVQFGLDLFHFGTVLSRFR